MVESTSTCAVDVTGSDKVVVIYSWQENYFMDVVWKKVQCMAEEKGQKSNTGAELFKFSHHMCTSFYSDAPLFLWCMLCYSAPVSLSGDHVNVWVLHCTEML